jgi:serine/threonine-protein kinase HipA
MRWRDAISLNLYGPRAITRMIDAIVVVAQDRPDKCGEIGFDDRQTKLLAQMLRTRIDSLR